MPYGKYCANIMREGSILMSTAINVYKPLKKQGGIQAICAVFLRKCHIFMILCFKRTIK